MTAPDSAAPGSSNLPMCGACGSTIWPGNYHSCKPVEHLKGWQCPICGTVYAPTVLACHNAHRPPPKAATGANDVD